jgi:hypothetical protein
LTPDVNHHATAATATQQRGRDFQSRFEIGEQEAIGNRSYDKSSGVFQSRKNTKNLNLLELLTLNPTIKQKEVHVKRITLDENKLSGVVFDVGEFLAYMERLTDP